jgi:hypothetical protein
MNRPRRVALCSALVIILAGCAVPGAPGLLSLTVVLDEAHTVHAGERVLGDIYALAGELTIAEGGSVGGSLLALGGEVTVGGRVAGDVSLIGGRLRLLPSAQVEGALTVAGGALELARGASVAGGVRQGEALPSGARTRGGSSLFDALLGLLLPALAAAALGFLLARYLPRPFGRVTDALADHAAVCAAMGLLAGLTAVVLLVLVAFTVLLIPFSIAGALALFAATACGWAAVGAALGRRITPRWPQLSIPQSAALGAFFFTAAAGLLRLAPLVGLLVQPLLASAALGAVLLTRLGLRKFAPAQDSAPSVVVE